MGSRKRIVLAAAVAVFLSISLVAAGGESDLNARRLEIKQHIMPAVAKLRGLSYLEDVPVNMVTQADVAKYVRKSINEDMTDEEMKGYQKMFSYMGLIPPDMDLKGVLVTAYSQQIAGFYDDHKKSFSIVRNSATPREMDPITISHELTHALQDQHYDLGWLQKRDKKDDDAGLALMALAEGDASEIMMRYATNAGPRSNGTVKDYTNFVSMSLGPESIPGLPLILTQEIMFPYTYGTRFVTALLKKGGPEAVDAAFRNPPVSTAQIMDPEKYFRHEEPYIIELADLTGSLGPGWRRVDQEPLGQFDLGIYFSVTIGTWDVDKAISGWRGDMLAGYSGPGKDDFFLVYYTTWNSYADAQAFMARYDQLIRTRFIDAKEARRDADRVTWTRGDRLYYLCRKGYDVLVVENVPQKAASDAILKSWDAPKVLFGAARPLVERNSSQSDSGGRSGRSSGKDESPAPEEEPALQLY